MRYLFLTAFFLGLFLSNEKTCAQESDSIDIELEIKELARSEQWRALIQLKNGNPRIVDPNFLLTVTDFSAENELRETIKRIDETPSLQCRFPARRILIERYTQVKLKNYNCPDFRSFVEKAPVDKLFLVYVTENLKSASSMLGHVMLKMEGETEGISVEHSVSYFTELGNLNIPGLMLQTLILGKESFFKVSPYSELLSHYSVQEQRNVWEFSLNTGHDDRALVQAALWELKETNLPYYFQKYNCATLTQIILSVVWPELLSLEDNWTTPLDVAKNVKKIGIIQSAEIYPSSTWLLRVLEDTLPKSLLRNMRDLDVNQAIERAPTHPTMRFYFLSYLRARTDYLREKGRITEEEWLVKSQLVNGEKISDGSDDWALDFSDYKNPLSSSGDSEAILSMSHVDQKNWLKFVFGPLSRGMGDDNREYLTEGELKLAELTLLFSTIDAATRLDRFVVYSMRTYVPQGLFSAGSSSSFNLGLYRHYDKEMKSFLAFETGAAIGKATELKSNLLVYGELRGVVVLGREHLFTQLVPRVGTSAYLFDIAKLSGNFSPILRVGNTQGIYREWRISSTLFLTSSLSMAFEIEAFKYKNVRTSSRSIGWRYRF